MENSSSQVFTNKLQGLPETDQVLGKVRLERVVGSGSMGVVYKGIEVDIDVNRAVKICLPDATKFDLARFRNEAKICAKLDHENIIKVQSVGYWKDTIPFAVMDFVDGPTLPDLIKQKGQLPVAFSLAVIAIISSALEYAHSQTLEIDGELYDNLIHRDIKPGNILITNKGIVKLTDFGLARFQESSINTIKGLVLGTLAYMAPEHQGNGIANVSTDIYAIGVTLYEMITGNRPFPEKGLDVLQTMLSAKSMSKYPRLRDVIVGIDPEVEMITEKCLDPDPQKRYSSYGVLRFAVDRVLERYAETTPENIVKLFISNKKAYDLSIRSKPGKAKLKLVKPILLVLLILMLIGGITCGVYYALFQNKKPDNMKTAPKNINTASALSTSNPDSNQYSPSQPLKKIVTVDKGGTDQRALRKDTLLNKPNNKTQQSSSKTSTIASLFSLYKENNYSDFLIKVSALDLRSIPFYQHDSAVIMTVESYYRTGQLREALAFAVANEVEDSKAYLLTAVCQDKLGMYPEVQKSVEKAVLAPSKFDATIKKKVLIYRARFYQRRFQELQTKELKKTMIESWQDFLTKECVSQSSVECDEARRIIGSN